MNVRGVSHAYTTRCVGLHRPPVHLMAFVGLALVPWTIFLGMTLPLQHHVGHWRLVWVGFDVMLTAACLVTVVLGRHHHPTVVMARLFTAVLLVCDAWFDVALALGTQEVWWSVASAVGIELPLAGYLLRRSHHLISRAPWAAAAADDDLGG